MIAAAPQSHFRLLGQFNVAPLMRALEDHAWMYGMVKTRQEFLGSPHKNTETIYLRWPAVFTVEAGLNSMDVIDHRAAEIPVFKEKLARLAIILDRPIQRAIVIKLAPGGHIAPHIDQGVHAEATERYHLCIETNRSCWMRSGGQSAHFAEGELWWFDKHALHEAGNDGRTDRVHLILDCLK